MPGSAELLDVLLAGGRRADRLTHVERRAPRPGRTAPWPQWADPALLAGYHQLGVEQPWTHQIEAAERLWTHRHTVLATSTGSGKSLAFWLPALTAVQDAASVHRQDAGRFDTRRSTILYLSPTKALAADQLAGLERLLGASGLRATVRAATCDGDTDATARRWVIDHADVVLTNPDFLHFALIPGHRRWARLLRSLRYVVVDESHAYRGVFGAHVALVLRRLRRVAALHGADPTFALASATTADPAASAARLLGVAPDAVAAVTDDGSPRGAQTIALWQPPELPGREAPGPERDDGAPTAPTAPTHRTATAEMAVLLTDLTVAGARTLAFTRSRRAAESVAATTRDQLEAVGRGL
ncbi:MAG TPA: DEAD/DEAH box helicase, partial [Actinotalea sp.]|nr:DEAD/DEAH box helicase [Actinotalea sp.]